MKVLFLDCDGVINTVGAELGFRKCLGIEHKAGLLGHSELFDPACLYYLREIVVKTGCKIVVSSTWRLRSSVDEMKAWFKCPEIRDAIIDKTPSFHGSEYNHLRDRRGRVQRGEEIKWWIDQHPEVTRYAILDDDSDMDIVYDNFFKTCSYDGLKKDVANRVILHLNNEELLDHYRMNNALMKFLSEARSCFGETSSYSEVEQQIISKLKMVNIDYEAEKRSKYDSK